MATEEQYQSGDIDQTNSTEGDFKNENDEETCTGSSSISCQQSTTRRSRFFRSKRRQRQTHDPTSTVSSSSDGSSESSLYSSESPEQSAEEKSDESFLTEASASLDPESSEPSRVWRCSSPPPPPLTEDTDTSSASDDSKLSTSIEENINENQISVKKESNDEKPAATTAKPAIHSIYAGYQRKKSQSVKLTRIDPIDACPKKAVRFADDFGLDLSQVKMIKSDELPHVPSAAFKDLCINRDETTSASATTQERTKTITYLEQLFENPIHNPGFDERVFRQKILLEQANSIDNRIYGTIKLLSLGMNKRVKIRLTTDNWNTCNDYLATYISNSYDGTFDRFSFVLDIDRDRIFLGNNIQFCICYETFAGQDHWDSNYQQNYRFDCVSRTIPDYSS